MWVPAFGGYIIVVLFFVFIVKGIFGAQNKLYDEGVVPVVEKGDGATDKQKIMACVYLLWFILNTAWLIFAFLWVLFNV